MANVAAHAAELSGRITDADGAPLSGVTVQAFDLRLDAAETTTNAQGGWTIASLEPGMYRIRAVPPAGMNNVTRFFPNTPNYCSAEAVTLEYAGSSEGAIDLALAEGATLTGTLVDSGGAAVGGALVVASGVDEYSEGLSRAAFSQSDGSFEILGLDSAIGTPATYVCEVQIADWPMQFLGATYDDEEATAFTVEIGQPTETGEHTLLDGIYVAGSVLHKGVGIADAYVHVYSSSQVVTVLTDGTGWYEAMGLPPGSVLSWTNPEGYGLTYYPDADRPSGFVDVLDEGGVYERLDLSLPAEAVLHAALLGEGDLAGVSALLYNDDKTVGIGEGAAADGEVVIEGLQGGDYTLFAYAAEEGYLDDYLRDETGDPAIIEIIGGADNDYAFELVPGGRISGIVTDDEGQPIEGASVIARRGDDARSAVTESDGAFEVRGLTGDRWTIEAYYTPYCSVDPGYVQVFYPDALTGDDAVSLQVEPDTPIDDVVLELPIDNDHDQMGDSWEERWGLDTSRDDSAEDPDNDGYTNLDEYRLGTNPLEDGRKFGCSCKGERAAAWLFPGLVAIGIRQRRRRR